MSEYISRTELVEALMEIFEVAKMPHDVAEAIADSVPAADVVEVIRCKDCRHYINDEHYGMMCEILVHAEQGDNFYCGYGQKKPEQEKWDV